MIEQIGPYRVRYCHDVSRRGKVRVYVERRPAGATEHLIASRNAPPHICFKHGEEPSSGAEARTMARRWVRCSENARRGRGFRE
jgi:hypothetical protein